MTTIQCVLIDDESKAITTLAYELQRIEGMEVVLLASFTQAQDALDYLLSPSGGAVDVVFLDIEMPYLDGLTFLDACKQRTFEVVFTTAYSHYAIEAIRKEAFDYLVKPIGRIELQSSLDRLAKRQQNKGNESLPSSEVAPFTEHENRIRFEIDKKIVFIDPDEIIYCEGDGNYCHIHLEQDRTLFLTQQLKTVGILLPQEQFLRAHKSYIVNLSKIKEYHRVEHYLLLSNGKHIPVSKHLWKHFTQIA